MNRPLMKASLDQVDDILADIRRTRSSAADHLLRGEDRLAAAQVDLMCHYVDVLVMAAGNAQAAGGRREGEVCTPP